MQGEETTAEAPLSLTWPLLAFLAAYGFIAGSLYLAALEDLTLLTVGMSLLPVLLTGFVLGGVFARYAAHRRFYLAAAILPMFTLISLTLVLTLPTVAQALVSYLVLGIALIVYQQATRSRIPPEGFRARDVVTSIPIALPLGFIVAYLGVTIFSRTSPYPETELTTAVLVAAAVAFLDEYLFRGVLQSQVGAVSRPAIGWLATAGLFVAFSAPSGDPFTILFRAWVGILLGFLVWWRRLLPLALMVRTTAAVFLVVLTASLEPLGLPI